MFRERTAAEETTCLPSSQGVTTVVMKNWEPLVSFPLFAMDSMPGLSCFSANVSSCALTYRRWRDARVAAHERSRHLQVTTAVEHGR